MPGHDHGRRDLADAAPTTVVGVGSDVVHCAASTIKLPLLVLALRRVDARLWSLPAPPSGAGASLEHELERMITVSDNRATNVLIDAIGVAAAAAEIRELGLPDTVLGRRLADGSATGSGMGNRTTAADLMRCLGLLLDGSTLTVASARVALDLLGRQQINDRMPTLLDGSVRCRHKTGELAGIRHDVGFLEFDGRRVLLAALGSNIPTASGEVLACSEATRVIGGAAALVVRIARSSG